MEENIYRKLYKNILSYQKENNISNRLLKSHLLKLIYDIDDKIEFEESGKTHDEFYNEKYKEMHEQYKDPIYSKMIKLEENLEQYIVDWIIDNPSILEYLNDYKDKRKAILGSNIVEPLISFGFGFDDVINRVKKGPIGGQDVYCGFTVGNNNLSLF